MNPKIIAFYLPQFYPFKENDDWWGKGFTEWTNVGKAKPLWKGHYQPKVPADLGYYDLRLPEVREQQVELAKEAGVYAFCYWHYWFGNGKRLLERVFNEVLESGKPDFPFCLGWANHSWYAKTWDKDLSKDQLLIEQTYPGIEDEKDHFKFLLKAFNDSRYVKINGCPFLFIYAPQDLPDEYISNFKKWTREAGFKDLYLVANLGQKYHKEDFIAKGYNSVVYNRLGEIRQTEYKSLSKEKIFKIKLKRFLKEKITGFPRHALDYKDYYPLLIDKNEDCKNDVIPQIVPQWDHSPRSGNKAVSIFYNATPDNFYLHAKDALNTISKKTEEEQILLLKSWNEWAEGNFMEPDLKYGKGFIQALKKALDNC